MARDELKVGAGAASPASIDDRPGTPPPPGRPFRVARISHVALELSSPTRMERYLRDAYGMQLLRVGYLRGEYVRIVGSPFDQRENPGFLHLYNRPFIPRGRLRHIAFAGAEAPTEEGVAALRARGHIVEADDTLVGPGDLVIKIDSLQNPRPDPVGDPITRMVEVEVDTALPCLVRSVHHVALEVNDPDAVLAWQSRLFGFDHRRDHDRRGELIAQIYYSDGPLDGIGRRMSLLPCFTRRGVPRTELNHIAFEVDDCDAAIDHMEARGFKVDAPADAMLHGPEEVWTQIDSRARPIPVGHPANDPGVTLVPYHNR